MNNVLSIEQMQKLAELGLDTSSASMFWYKNNESPKIIGEYLLMPNNGINRPFIGNGDIPAYTFLDILEKLPEYIFDENVEYEFQLTKENVRYYSKDPLIKPLIEFCSNNLLDAAYKLFIWCIENGYIHKAEE